MGYLLHVIYQTITTFSERPQRLHRHEATGPTNQTAGPELSQQARDHVVEKYRVRLERTSKSPSPKANLMVPQQTCAPDKGNQSRTRREDWRTLKHHCRGSSRICKSPGMAKTKPRPPSNATFVVS